MRKAIIHLRLRGGEVLLQRYLCIFFVIELILQSTYFRLAFFQFVTQGKFLVGFVC